MIPQRASLRKTHEDVASFDTRLEPLLPNRGAELMPAVADVELPAVPGACDDAAFEPPFAQRAALMRADAVEREELAADVKQRDDSVAGHRFQATAGRTISCRSDAVPHGGRRLEVGGWRLEVRAAFVTYILIGQRHFRE